MIAKRLFLNHSPSEWFSFIQKKRQLNSQRFMDHFLCVLRKMVRM